MGAKKRAIREAADQAVRDSIHAEMATVIVSSSMGISPRKAAKAVQKAADRAGYAPPGPPGPPSEGQ